MTRVEFLEQHNYSSSEFYEVAEIASKVTDDEDLANTSKYFLEAKENLEIVLDEIGFEFG